MDIGFPKERLHFETLPFLLISAPTRAIAGQYALPDGELCAIRVLYSRLHDDMRKHIPEPCVGVGLLGGGWSSGSYLADEHKRARRGDLHKERNDSTSSGPFGEQVHGQDRTAVGYPCAKPRKDF